MIGFDIMIGIVDEAAVDCVCRRSLFRPQWLSSVVVSAVIS